MLNFKDTFAKVGKLFQKKQELPVKPISDPAFLDTANAYLSKTLNNMHLNGNIHSRGALLGINSYKLTCISADLAARSSPNTLVNLGMNLVLDEKGALVAEDYVLGYGDSVNLAIQNAVDNYILNVFGAFFSLSDSNVSVDGEVPLKICSFTEEANLYTHWQGYKGNDLMLIDLKKQNILLERLNDNPSITYIFNELSSVFGQSDRIHWAKLFLYRGGEGELNTECRIDNFVYPSGNDSLTQFPWPTSNVDQWIRQYFVFYPIGQSDSPDTELAESVNQARMHDRAN